MVLTRKYYKSHRFFANIQSIVVNIILIMSVKTGSHNLQPIIMKEHSLKLLHLK